MWLSAHDVKYAEELEGIDLDTPQDHRLLGSEAVARSQKLFGVLLSFLKGRRIRLVKEQGVEEHIGKQWAKSTRQLGKHGEGFPKTAGQAHKTGIRKQRRRYQKTAQQSENNIRKQEKENQKTVTTNNEKTKKVPIPT